MASRGPTGRLTLAFAVAIGAVAASTAAAQQLAIRRYTVGEGLSHDTVTAITQDRQGFLWVSTYEGLSRFDGYRFTRYHLADGLTNVVINATVEDRDGGFWVATNGGGIGYLPNDTSASSPRGFRMTLLDADADSDANNVNGLALDRDGTLWCATDRGIFFAKPGGNHRVSFSHLSGHETTRASETVLDARGDVWFALDDALLRVADGGRTATRVPFASPVRALAAGPDGRILVVTGTRAYQRAMDGSETWIPLDLPIASFPPGAGALVDRHGDCWIGTFTGLIRKTPERVIAYSVRHGLPMGVIRAIHEDRGGTIWIGSSLGGVAALRPDTIGSFTIPDWLPPDQPTWVAAAPGDVIYAGSADGSIYELGDDHVRRLSGPDPELAFPAAPLPGPNGDWWGISRHRVVRFPGPGLDPRRRETFALPGPEALLVPRSSLAPDPAGLFWMTLQDGTTWRFDPRRAGPPIFERRMPATSEPFVPALIHADGTMWGGRMTLLGRLAPSGQVTPIEMDRFATQPRFLYTDRGGRLWVALRFGGLLRIDDPWAATPVVSRRYTVSDGLASDAVWSIVEDPDRQLYLATYRGLDQLDPATGRIRHLRSADGLAGDVVTNCTFDARARLWCASGRGVSWIDTARVWRTEPPPAVYITRLRVAGDDIPVGETGTVHVAPIRVAASKNELQIEFVGLRLGASHQLQYQYRLIGADDRWSALGPDRSVNYSGRQPGQYRFEVRAVDQDGQLSGEVATVDLEILAPFYRRTWFLLLVISAPAAVVFWLQRQRLRHIMAIERVRRQVATDVHDELGSGLSQIAILGEVVKRQASPAIRPIVGQVTDLARTLRASMGDVIWAVDPRRDRLGDLVARMRAVAGTLEADGVAVTFDAPAADLERIELPPDRRRHLLLVFKEAITNITRHAHATSIHVRLDVRGRTLSLTIADNGVGFDQARMTSGQGLGNLQRRADLLRGSLAIESVPGSGTTIRLQAPIT